MDHNRRHWAAIDSNGRHAYSHKDQADRASSPQAGSNYHIADHVKKYGEADDGEVSNKEGVNVRKFVG